MVFAWGAESFVVHLPDLQSGDTVMQPCEESLHTLVCGQSAADLHCGFVSATFSGVPASTVGSVAGSGEGSAVGSEVDSAVVSEGMIVSPSSSVLIFH